MNPIVFSTSLFGSAPKYLNGAVACAQEMQAIQRSYGPARLAIYYDGSVPIAALHKLRQFEQVDLIFVESKWVGVGTVGSMYRFMGFEHYKNKASIVLTWDLDNTIDSDYFRLLYELISQGDRAFYVLKKIRSNGKRRFNADCWAAVPHRLDRFGAIAAALSEQTRRYAGYGEDTVYGCDERLQNKLIHYLFSLPEYPSGLLKIYQEELQDPQSGNIVDYDSTQRLDDQIAADERADICVGVEPPTVAQASVHLQSLDANSVRF